MGRVSLILFDINGVLYDYDKKARIAALGRLSGRSENDIDCAIWKSGFEDRGDAGEMDAAAYLAEFGQRLGYALTADQWEEALASSLSPVPEALALAARAGGRARLGVLTNNNLLVRDRIDRLFPALRPIFGNGICVSSQFGIRKPEIEVYRRAAAALGAAPEATLFVDDSRANAAGAEKAGLLGYHYTGTAALEQRLREVGAIPP